VVFISKPEKGGVHVQGGNNQDELVQESWSYPKGGIGIAGLLRIISEDRGSASIERRRRPPDVWPGIIRV
jgi:hypothetical protein